MNKNKEIKKNKKSLPLGIKIIDILLMILSILCLVVVGMLNILPLKYFVPVILVVLIIDVIMMILLKKKGKPRKVGLVISLILIILYVVGLVYANNTHDFLKKINGNTNVANENYVVVVKSDSNYKDIKDLKNADLGVLNCDEEGYKKAEDTLSKTIKYNQVAKDDSYTLTDSLLNGEFEGFLLEESQEKILEENYDGFTSKTRILYTFTIQVTEESVTKETDITKDSFNILISGIDTYGKINTVSRSDVNIVVTVNPKTGKISLVHIPRDYYVQLYKKNGLKDKLTHAGIYGADTSVKTVEKLLDIDINYYIKFNFTSVIDIVDTIGPIKVYSDQTFTSGLYDDNTNEAYTYVKGYNTLNGKETLSFCRERHSLADGDRARGEHQEAVIEAIIKKMTTPAVLTKYSKLMSTLSDTFITNLGEENMTNFVKKQLNDNTDWETTKMVMDGKSSMEYTYSYPRQKLYVMIPSEDSINQAKEQISSVYNG
jgi:polyisoprenyl-teichoic acid--peptidoglycan teichoic acid transferase